MDADWVVGMLVFIVFTGWALSYYFAFFQADVSDFETAAEAGQSKVMDFVSVPVYEIPVRYYSNGPVTDGVLKAKSIWYSGEKNSTIVFSAGSPLPCRIDGDDLYWQADLSDGYNNFTIATADANSTANCTGAFGISSSNQTEPWVAEEGRMISLARISEMAGMEYDEFRSSLGMNQNFMFTIKSAGLETEYGKSIPSGPVDVNLKTTEWRIYETREKANVTIAVW
jgi:hypothetical protein